MRPPGLPLAVLSLLLVTAVAIPSTPLTPISEQARASHPHHAYLLSHGVEDVPIALSNATSTALHHADAILRRYADVLRVIAIPTGLAVCFFGYFLLAPVLFLAAFVSGGGACFVAVGAVIGDDTPAAAWISIAAMLLGGALLGFLALRALHFGMFAVGAALGVVLASSLKTTLLVTAYPKDPQLAFIVAAVVFGLLLGLLAICLQKQMLIFSTAYAGSCACMFGIGHFAGHFPTAKELSDVQEGHVNTWLILYFALTLLLGTIGMLFQFWLARGKPMPEHAPHDKRRRRRRVRQYDYPDFSDEDDWAGDVYVERVPLPRRKSEPGRAPMNASSDGNVPVYERQSKSRGGTSHTTVSQSSWDNVQNAPAAFQAISSGEEIASDRERFSSATSRSMQSSYGADMISTKKNEETPSEMQKPARWQKERKQSPADDLFDHSGTLEGADPMPSVTEVRGSLEQVSLESDVEGPTGRA